MPVARIFLHRIRAGRLRVGQKLPGIITNVTAFGAFVDVGVHQDGLVHVSHLADRYVSNPHEVAKVGQRVEVTVLEVDAARKRIALSLKSDPTAAKPAGSSGKKSDRAKPEEAPQDDFQTKLAKLKGMFK